MEDRETAAPEPTEEVVSTEDQTATQAEETTTAEPTVEEGEATGPDSDEKTEATQDEEKPRQKSRAQKRIETLASRNRIQAEENARLRKRIDEAEKRLKELKPPDEDDFDDHDEYQEARLNHKVEEKLVQRQKDIALQEIRDQEEQSMNVRAQVFAENLQEFKNMTPDFDEVVNSGNIGLTTEMHDAIIGSLQGPGILYYLSQNPDLAVDMARMTPIEMARTMGKLEARLENNTPRPSMIKKPITNAPPPVKPLRPGGSPPPVDPNKLPVDVDIERRIKRLRGER